MQSFVIPMTGYRCYIWHLANGDKRLNKREFSFSIYFHCGWYKHKIVSPQKETGGESLDE